MQGVCIIARKRYGGPGGRATRRCLCDDGDATIDDDDTSIDDDDGTTDNADVTIDDGDAIIYHIRREQP